MTLYEMLQHSAQQDPSRICLRFGDDTYTYGSMLSSINRVGNYLLSQGVKRGDRVAMVLPNTPAFFISYFAVTGIGAVAVPINPVWTADELGFVLRDAEAQVLIAAPLPAVQTIANSVPLTLWAVEEDAVVWNDILRSGDTSALPGPESQHSLAVFIYTSGTTGKPKGAMLTHRNLTANAQSTNTALQVNANDVFLCVLPLFHCLAATVTMLMPIGLGAEIVLLEQFVPKIVLESIARYHISVLVGVPAMFVVLTSSNAPKDTLSSVRVCLSGGAPLPVSILERFQAAYGVPIREGYGLSEASPVVSVNWLPVIKPGTIGPPIPGVRVRVVDNDGNDVSTGEPGELLVQGENVMAGYFRLPEASEQALRQGWLHTGDIATLDADGYITIVDRLKDMIIVGGLKVYPREVEEVLYSHPKVKEAAVVGVMHELRGESVKAVISLKDGESLASNEVISYCRERLANYKVPKTVVFVDALPKSSTGKILKRLLAGNEG